MTSVFYPAVVINFVCMLYFCDIALKVLLVDENAFNGHSRSSAMSLLERSHMIS